ncbi:hypothetical protein JCM17961_00860 [Endothiovibrio diazotrophicus]
MLRKGGRVPENGGLRDGEEPVYFGVPIHIFIAILIRTRTIRMTLDDELVAGVDSIVAAQHTTRSAFPREALRLAVDATGTNRWRRTNSPPGSRNRRGVTGEGGRGALEL